jgi:hypothetical protein
MSPKERVVLRLQEYGAYEPIVRELADQRECSLLLARDLLARTGDRIQRTLQLESNPLLIVDARVRAIDMAGMARVTTGVELEICPKYLDHDSASWREDLLFLASLGRYGRLLTADRLGSRRSHSPDFATLLARVFVRLYSDNQRRPLRTYETLRHEQFAFDGELDPLEVFLPQEDGYGQFLLELTKCNKYNAAIVEGIRRLEEDIRNPQLLRQLELLRTHLSPQKGLRSLRMGSVPSRSKGWQPLVDLACDLVKGGTQVYGGRVQAAPGYVIDTWRVWEQLVGVALRLRVKAGVRLQRSFSLGTRTRWRAGHSSAPATVHVRPDAVVVREEAEAPYRHIIIDAKYKTRSDRGELRIAEADLYESLAFAAAVGANRVILVYPRSSVPGAPVIDDLGETERFEEIEVEGRKVIGVTVQVQGIGKSGGLGRFASTLQASLSRLLLGGEPASYSGEVRS